MSEHDPGQRPGEPDPLWAPPATASRTGPGAPQSTYAAPPAQPAYPPPYATRQPATTFPHREPTPYHQMLRTWTYEPWKPVVGIVICLAAFLFLTALVFIVVALIAAAFSSGPFIDDFMKSADFTDVSPTSLLGLNLGLASLVLVTWFVIRVVHRMR